MIAVKRGAWFIKEALRLIFSNRAILLSSVWFIKYALILAAWIIIPIVLIVTLGNNAVVSFTISGFFCGLFIYLGFVLANISSIGTIIAFNQNETANPATSSGADKVRTAHWKDILQYSLALPALNLAYRKPIRMPASSLALSEPSMDWVSAHFLVAPIISIESLSLAKAIERVKGVSQSNLVHAHPGVIKVPQLLRWVSMLLIAVAILLGIRMGMHFAGDALVGSVNVVLAILIGALVALLITIPVIGLHAMVKAIYYTCLYRWLLAIEDQGRGDAAIKIPEILGRAIQMV